MLNWLVEKDIAPHKPVIDKSRPEDGTFSRTDFRYDPNGDEPSRKVARDIHEHARDVARSFAGTEGSEQSRRERKKIEKGFAQLKRILRLG